jgi:hypothetical protein
LHKEEGDMKTVLVGDVHATPGEISDCEALLNLVYKTIDEHKAGHVLFLGDLHNCHNVLDSRVVAFWTNSFRGCVDRECQVTALVGNHDFLSPSLMMPHSIVAHKFMNKVTIVETPVHILNTNYCAMPYYYDSSMFVIDAVRLKKENPTSDVLFCHQTFCGADARMGFYSKESIESSAIPFKIVLPGHIHTPMVLGKVKYIGAPRWRTLTDAEVETRNIYVLEPGKSPVAIPTNTHCTRIFRLEDSEASPVQINLTQEQLKLADLRITINGTQDYISKRMTELKAQYNAKCRGVPVRGRLAKASESEGIDKAFQNFAKSFNPPNGTDLQLLQKECYGRL